MKNCQASVPVGVFLIDSLGSGGAQRQFVGLVRQLDKNRVRPVVVVYHDLPFFKADLEAAGIEIHLIRKTDKAGIGFLVRFIRLLRQVRPAFVHSFLNTPNFYARMAKLVRAVDTVITSERSIAIAYNRRLSLLEKLTWRLSDRIIVNAEEIRGLLRTCMGVDSDRVRLVYNGLKPIGFIGADSGKVKALRRRLGLEPYILIGLVGRIAPEKNHRALINALDILRLEPGCPRISAGFWGRGPVKFYFALRKKVKEKGLEPMIRFMGTDPDIRTVYAACDIIVLPSTREGCPNVLLEAMAAGRPVVASDIADNAVFVRDGENGFLVGPQDHAMLARRITRIIRMSDKERLHLGRQAREQISNEFTMARMTERTMDVYRELKLIK